MGTRADFYVGKHKDAEWIGSIAYDGYRDGIDADILKAPTEADFRKAVATFLSTRDDATVVEQGWPWPWDDSATSDCSYWFFDGQVWDASGHPEQSWREYYSRCAASAPETAEQFAGLERIQFPDMSARKNVTLGPRSGVMFIKAM